MKNLNNTEAEMKKALLIKKTACNSCVFTMLMPKFTEKLS